MEKELKAKEEFDEEDFNRWIDFCSMSTKLKPFGFKPRPYLEVLLEEAEANPGKTEEELFQLIKKRKAEWWPNIDDFSLDMLPEPL